MIRQISLLQAAYASNHLSPVKLIADMCDKIDAYSDKNVFISRVTRDELLRQAAALDPALRAVQPLWGIPFAVKDNIDVAGLVTTAACPEFAYRAAAHAPAVARLIEAGAICVGKTNLDQFATGLNGTRSPYGAPACVFDSRYISGGSSSGSGVAVGAGLVSFALGTDTAGSGRVPAAFNNIVGLKPTKGTISSRGMVPACRSLDCISVLATNCVDADLVFRVMRGFDAADGYSRPCQDLPLEFESFRFGVLAESDREFCGDLQSAALYQAAIDKMESLGGTAIEINYQPFRDAAALLYDGAFVAERAAAIGEFVESHLSSIDPSVASIMTRASQISGSDVFKSIYRLQDLTPAAKAEWGRVDFLLLPTAPTIFTIEAMRADPIRLNGLLGLYTNFVNLLDCAAIAVPAGFCGGNGLPFGVTLIGPAFTDRALAFHADRFHRAQQLPAANSGSALAPCPLPPPANDYLQIVVGGAHLSGMVLNTQLTDLGARLLRATRTAAHYRLYALAGTVPPKPGLVRDPNFSGDGIDVEIWLLAPAAFGTFIAALPQPMCIGKVELSDGSQVSGFLCEPTALENAVDITHFGGWRAYMTHAASPAHQPLAQAH